MKIRSGYGTCAIILLVLAGTVGASAQYGQSKTTQVAGDNGMTTEFVKTGLYVVSGGGSNSVLRLSANGLILVNGKLPGNYSPLLAKVRKISDQPIRALILSNYDKSCAGNNETFQEAGTRIVSHKDTLSDASSTDPAIPSVSPASITFASQYRLQLGGVEAALMHFGNAHTNNDTVVYFPNLKTVAVGDLFASTPDPEFSAGGSLVDWGPVLAQVLKLDFDVVIPNSGPAISRADLEGFKAKIDTLVSRAALLVGKGVSKDQLMGQLRTDDLGFQLSFTPEQVHGFYAELSVMHPAQLNVTVAGR
jgi:cyclase